MYKASGCSGFEKVASDNSSGWMFQFYFYFHFFPFDGSFHNSYFKIQHSGTRFQVILRNVRLSLLMNGPISQIVQCKRHTQSFLFSTFHWGIVEYDFKVAAI